MASETPHALVVEDDPSWQQILVEILTDMGLEVDLARSYDEAVAKLKAFPHRIAILDLSLGGTDHRNQDGLRVAEAATHLDPNCILLFLTGFATVEFAVHVMKEQGAFTCLRKEVFRRSEFRKIVNDALSQAQIITATAVEPKFAQQKGSKLALVENPSGADVEIPAVALVVEDDAGWRSLLGELLTDAGYRVQLCSSYIEAIGFLKRDHSDVAVVDLSLASSLSQENMDGYRLLTAMQKSRIPAIVVSGYADPVRIEQAYRDRIIYSCMEKQAFDRKVFLQTVNDARLLAVEDPMFRSLTEREREVLALLARGLTNKEIARELTITPNTVKRHIKSLFAKLEVNTRSAASARAINMGLGENSSSGKG